MKTAMQVTIDKMNEAKENLLPISFHGEFLRGFNKAFQMAVFIAEKNGLEAEKKQIMEAFEAGTKEDLFNTWSIPEEVYKKEKSLKYFQQTYKSDE